MSLQMSISCFIRRTCIFFYLSVIFISLTHTVLSISCFIKIINIISLSLSLTHTQNCISCFIRITNIISSLSLSFFHPLCLCLSVLCYFIVSISNTLITSLSLSLSLSLFLALSLSFYLSIYLSISLSHTNTNL